MPLDIRPLIAGNWKMNCNRKSGQELARELVRRVRQSESEALRGDVLLCPPATLLSGIAEIVSGSPVLLGGQDCHSRPGGAFTGDVSAAQLVDAGCSHVILGHSERRAAHHETDAEVRAKVEAAHAAGLIAIVCVGEREEERKAGRTLAVVAGQFRASLPASSTADNTVVAYEPVWAIGSGKVPTSDEIAVVHGQLRRLASQHVARGELLKLLYGGSVKPSNALEILAIEDVNGALVGGASLNADDFWAIAKSCPWSSRRGAIK